MKKSSSVLSEQDQLDLLKDSIELRFTNASINEFSSISKFDPSRLNKFEPAQGQPENHFNQLAFADFNDKEVMHKNIRQLCGISMLVSLFIPFVQISQPQESITGLDLIASLLGITLKQFSAESWAILMAIFPLTLTVYAGILITSPAHWAKLSKFLNVAWPITICTGILHFFVTHFVFLESSVIAGVGYYVAMVALISFYYLGQLADFLNQPESSTAKL